MSKSLFIALSAFVCFFNTPAQAQQDSPREVHFEIRPHAERFDGEWAHWNTPETAVQAQVGDILVITNNDSVPHMLHTSNSTPCPHPHLDETMEPGESWSCVLETPFNALEADQLSITRSHLDYDQHFYIIVSE